MKEETKKALLVGLHLPAGRLCDTERSLLELEELARNIGLEPSGKMLVKLKGPSPRYIVGTGKAEEIREAAREAEAGFIVFDNDLSPSQQRNWEEFTELCVIDRQEVILEIFSDRAVTREAHLQVELARMEYSLPRLTRAWTHLSRQRGGKRGTRGEGETQLEMDRRRVLDRIVKAKAKLKLVRAQRKTRRALRTRSGTLSGSIVGYTNAGKSSLLNALTGAGVHVEDKFFATLDPTTRKIRLPSGEAAVLTDTVGFIRNLPHHLVESFKATLEETVLADFLVHVLDSSDPDAEDHAATTRETLRRLGAADKPTVTVWNKIDLCPDPSLILALSRSYPYPVLLSSKTGEGLDTLLEAIDLVRLSSAESRDADRRAG